MFWKYIHLKLDLIYLEHNILKNRRLLDQRFFSSNLDYQVCVKAIFKNLLYIRSSNETDMNSNFYAHKHFT